MLDVVGMMFKPPNSPKIHPLTSEGTPFFRTHTTEMYSRPKSSKHDAISSMSSSVIPQLYMFLMKECIAHTKGRRITSCSLCGALSSFHKAMRKCAGTSALPDTINSKNRPQSLGGYMYTPRMREQGMRTILCKYDPISQIERYATSHTEYRRVPRLLPSPTVWGLVEYHRYLVTA